MATKTEKYELRKKEENDFYNIEDFNDNMDKLETALTEFDDSGSVDGISSFTEMLTKFVTGNKLAVTLGNLKAGLQFVLHTGSIVNNCVTDNPKLPLSAAQGKVLMDLYTQLYSDLTKQGAQIGRALRVYNGFTSDKSIDFTIKFNNSHMCGILLVDQNRHTDIYITGIGSGIVTLNKDNINVPTLSAEKQQITIPLTSWGKFVFLCPEECTITQS